MDERDIRPKTIELTGQQRAIFDGLLKLDQSVASWYYGAILALNQKDNPERFVHAAHSVREIMEKMPRYLDVKIKRAGGNLGSKLNDFVDCWGKVTASRSDSGWSGEIDGALSKGLKKVDELVSWHKENRPRVKEITKDTLRKLDGSKFCLPEPLENLNIDAWLEIYDFFQGVSHHKTTTEKEFDDWLYAFERFLLDRLSPRTFYDFEQIDKLIKEGESND